MLNRPQMAVCVCVCKFHLVEAHVATASQRKYVFEPYTRESSRHGQRRPRIHFQLDIV
jgi:hypothetical protein